MDEVALDADSRVFRSTLIGNVNKLKSDVSALKTDVRQCKLSIGSLSPALPHSRGVSFCWLYVSLCVVGAGVGKVELERLLCCQVIQYVRLMGCTQLAFKVKILESDLRVALESGRVSGCRVHLWKNSPGSVAQQGSIGGLDERVISGASKRVSSQSSMLRMACWNCRGLWSSIPYIESLVTEGVKVLVLAEHWLWPYELERLSAINDDFEAIGKADVRLSEDSDGGRGFGGIGMLWHKSLRAAPLSGILSDRICGIRFNLGSEGEVMSVIGVYLPCLDQGLNCYGEHLTELERVITECEALGPVVVMGDFNAHLSAGGMNVQGVLLKELMDRCGLTDASSGCLAKGPDYTYCSGVVRTKVDYALMNVEAASLLSDVKILEMEDLNTSDHLPIVVSVTDGGSGSTMMVGEMGRRVAWDKVTDDVVDGYVGEVRECVAPFMNSVYSDIVQLGSEIQQVADVLIECGLKHLPLVNGNSRHVWKDKVLADLCSRSSAARVMVGPYMWRSAS